MQNWTLRAASIEDVAALTELRVRFLLEVGDAHAPHAEAAIRDYFLGRLAGDDFRVWVAEAEGEIVATCGLLLVSKPPSGHNPSGREGYVMNVYTRPERRGQGLATALLRETVAYLEQEGVSTCRLHVVGPGALYEQLGFVEEGAERVLRLSTRCRRLGELPAALASLPRLTPQDAEE